eukprot:m.89022 g.89022  ORF g.89022 m.89022 type:complete len:161 (+) comp14845_c1_seq5:72-554(+)
MRATQCKPVPTAIATAILLVLVYFLLPSSSSPNHDGLQPAGKQVSEKEEGWKGVINNLIDSQEDHVLRKDAEELILVNKHLADALEMLNGKHAEMLGIRSQLSELDQEQQKLGRCMLISSGYVLYSRAHKLCLVASYSAYGKTPTTMARSISLPSQSLST